MPRDLADVQERVANLLDGTGHPKFGVALRRATFETGDALRLHGYNVPDTSATTLRVRLHPSDKALNTERSQFLIKQMIVAVVGEDDNYRIVFA